MRSRVPGHDVRIRAGRSWSDLVEESDAGVVLWETKWYVKRVQRHGTVVRGESKRNVECVERDGALVLWDWVLRYEQRPEVDVLVIGARMVVVMMVVVVVLWGYLDLQLDLLVLKTLEEI